ncbi:hypothetical protein [Kangiella geojedonensis]|uniref:Uncharacterized protein n=1 Tax=Kangiella geojedonensis TaxID=914150 RepID=A0A0F6RC21_9GAMM|nr:hypothetical protein [Kangiella geojedonensis]AKE51656.1 hypothetical protein TQ33_0679 [Kangiella geojedonensis]
MKNITMTALYVALGLVAFKSSQAVERGPLLMSEVPSDQVYSESDITAIKSQDIEAHKSTATNSLAQEYQLYIKVKAMAVRGLSDEEISFLNQASRHKATAFQRHPEGPIAVPVFDVASLAKHKLFMADVYHQQKELSPLLNADPASFARMSTATPANTQAAKLLLEGSVPKADGEVSSASISSTMTNLLVDQYKHIDSESSLVLLKALVEATHNYSAAEALLTSKQKSPLKHHFLENLGNYFSEREQEVLLKQLIANESELASQALIKYGQLPLSILDADLLYTKLADPKLGASSALSIARLLETSPDYARVINHVKAHQKSRAATANSLLVLKLADTAESKAALQDILDKGYLQFEDMKVEVYTWLN